MGYYDGWDGNVDIALARQDAWYNVEKLFQVIRTMRRSNLTFKDDRQSAFEILNTLPCNFPATKTTRFPIDQVFIRESDGEWVGKFSQLRTLLQDWRLGVTDDRQDLVLKSVYAALDAFMQKLREKTLIYDMNSFEKSLKITWNPDTKVKSEPK